MAEKAENRCIVIGSITEFNEPRSMVLAWLLQCCAVSDLCLSREVLCVTPGGELSMPSVLQSLCSPQNFAE